MTRRISIDALGGILLILVTILALSIVNFGGGDAYERVLGTYFDLGIGAFQLHLSILHWINDGLMAIFFLLVGLEIKRELLEGELDSKKKAALPVITAIGGMALPALIFLALNLGRETARGWAIPAATDIAFVIGILSLLSRFVPTSLKVFLTTLAVLDDLGAIAIIAFFYTEGLSFVALGAAALVLVPLYLLHRARVASLWPYLLLGLLLWTCVLKSGVHATLSGVLLAAMIPLSSPRVAHSPLERLEKRLKPWVLLFVMPVFALANAGVSLHGLSLDVLTAPLTLGIVLGLFLGKQIGVFAAALLAVKAGITELPARVQWRHVYGAALLAGIGFTMSLFLGALAFTGQEQTAQVKIGVLLASALSGGLGVFVLVFFRRRAREPRRGGEGDLDEGSPNLP